MTRRLLSISALASILLAGLPGSPALALDEADRLWLVGERSFADGLHPVSRRVLDRFVVEYPERHAARTGSPAPGTVPAGTRRAREGARCLSPPPRRRVTAGAAARGAILGSRVALSSEAIRRGARCLRRRDQQGRGLGARARGPLRSRLVRARAAAAGARDQGLPRSPRRLARAPDVAARDLLSGADPRRAQALSRRGAVAHDVRDEISQAQARARRAVPARIHACGHGRARRRRRGSPGVRRGVPDASAGGGRAPESHRDDRQGRHADPAKGRVFAADAAAVGDRRIALRRRGARRQARPAQGPAGRVGTPAQGISQTIRSRTRRPSTSRNRPSAERTTRRRPPRPRRRPRATTRACAPARSCWRASRRSSSTASRTPRSRSKPSGA